MKKHILGLLFLLICCTNYIGAQVVTEFWFAAPHISEHSRVTGEYHIILFAYDQSAHVVIAMPANSSFVNKEYDLPPYGYVDVIMASDYDDATANFDVPLDVVSQRGIYISSTAKIGGYYQHAGRNSEAFSFKENAVGTDFLVTSQITHVTPNNGAYVNAYSSIQIVATENNTTVTITPAYGHQLGLSCNASPVVVNLNRGETYAIRTCNKDPQYGVNGTRITSNKGITVTTIDDSTQPDYPNSTGADLMGDQIVPITLAGTEYVVIGQLRNWNECFVTAIENGTTVNLGNGSSFTLQKNETRTISMSTIKALYISSNKPIIVYQLTGEENEAAGTVLPKLACTGSPYAVYKKLPNSYSAFLNIVVRAADIGKIYINDNHIASSNFHSIAGTTDWYYAAIDISSYSSDVIRIKSLGGLFQLGALDMIGVSMDDLASCSYGYFSDYGTAHEYDEYATFAEGTTCTWANHFFRGTTIPMTFSSEGVYVDDQLKDINGCDSICVLHLSKIPYPDNVADVECVVPPTAVSFEMRELYHSAGAHSMSTPLIGDVDGDGVTDIVTCYSSLGKEFWADGLLVYDGTDGHIKDTIMVASYALCGQPVAIADVDRDGKSEIFILAIDMYVYCYNYDGTLRWRSETKISDRFIPQVADLNNDGHIELVMGEYIYDAASGTLLLNYTMTENAMGFGAPTGIYTPYHYLPLYLFALYDVDGDGTLEVCAGNSVYKLKLQNLAGTTGNSVSVIQTAQSNTAYTNWNYDGMTFITDFDNDGDGDICVIGASHDAFNTAQHYIDTYVWDGQTSELIAYNRRNATRYNSQTGWHTTSIPFAGDINGDGFVEIIYNQEEDGMIVYCYDSSTAGHMRLVHRHESFAETAGFTVFDFNMDGRSEIVYRGDHYLNIVDGITFDNLSTPIDMVSVTMTEYPVVADVNGDGSAEIIITYTDSRYKPTGWVGVYGSANGEIWSSARSVWNQWAYNSININDDMSVPQHMYDVATLFPNGTRPFNSFLAQKPIIDKQGDIFVSAADAAVTSCTSEVINDSVNITISFCNNGDANLVAPYEIAVYQNEYRGRVVQVDTIKEGLAINGCTSATIKVPALSVCQAAVDNTFIIAINDDGHGIAQHGNQQAECDTTNNRTSIVLPPNLRRDTTRVSIIIDQGDTYTFNGHTYSTDTQDTATFSSAAGCDSVCILDLKVIPYPDNVSEVPCTVDPPTKVWSIRRSAISTQDLLDDCSTTMVGDIDGDGQVEIIAPINGESMQYEKIGIFDAQANVKRIINIPGTSIFTNIAIAKVKTGESQYTTLFFFLAYDKYIYAYTPTGTQYWKSNLPFSHNDGELVPIASLSLADFNHDGWSEIYLGSEIFDAATGNKLCAYDGNRGHADRSWKASRQMYQSVAADVIGDSNLELLIGNCACTVSINSRTDATQNSIVRTVVVPTSTMKMEDNSSIPSTDGFTLCADMDGDGKLDAIVMWIDKSNRVLYVYIWNPRDGTILGTRKIVNVSEFGTPNIGDVDNDGNLELNFIIGTQPGETTDTNDRIFSLKYNKSTHSLDVFWTLHHDDASGATGLTLFDFNQDGTKEIVYRDCENLRIINGSMKHHLTGAPVAAPYDLATIPCTSGTATEYPVIADVDADGEAEIVVVGEWKLQVYKSNLEPWAPARKVWNQYAYNITNVNEDLTIPTYLYNNAHIFTDVSSTTRQPFNNFLAQTTTINKQGVPFIAAADVNVSTTTTATYEDDSIKIDISFCNQGDLQVNAPYCITAYKDTYRGSVLFVDTIKAILPIGDCLSHQVGFPISNVCSDKDINTIVIAVNDDGHGIAQHGNQQAECDTTNNRTSVSLPTDFRTDTTKYTPVICATELPYTFTPTGTLFPVGTTSGRTIISKTNKYGCDSIITIDLTVNPTLTGDTTATFCNGTPFVWHGTSYPTGGDYPYTYTSKVAPYCDSIVTLHLTQLEPTDSVENVTLCAGGSHTWHGQTFTTSTTITETIPNAAGCDSVCTLNLTILPALTGDTSATFCKGTPFVWHGTSYPTGGDYPYTYTSKVAPYCDSIVTLHLTQLEPTDSVENVTLCAGGSHTWHGQTFTSSTTITETIPNAAGCDSVCTLHLKVNPKLTGDTAATFCNGHPFKWHGVDYPTGGDYPYTYTSKVTGCDSIVTLHLTQLEPTDSIEVVTICAGASHIWHGHTYTSSIDIIETIDNAAGCDSVCTLKLTVLPALTGDTAATFCSGSSFEWHEVAYGTAGDYPYTYSSKVAPYCDSIVTLHLSEKQCCPIVQYVAVDTTICDSLMPYNWQTWETNIISSAGYYEKTLQNDLDCDSIIYQLNLNTYHCCAPMNATIDVPNVCADAPTIPIQVNLLSGEISEYSLHFTNPPLNKMPFRDTTITIETQYSSATPIILDVPIPFDPSDSTKYPRPDDSYKLSLSVRDSCGNQMQWGDNAFTIMYPSWITEQHWDDVIAIVNDKYNGGYTFSKVEWLRDGETLPGENNLYIYLPHELWTNPNHQYQSYQYQALLTRRDDGKAILSCPIEPKHINNSNMMDGNEPYVDVTPIIVPIDNPVVHIMTNTKGTYWLYNVAGQLLQSATYEPCEHTAFDIQIPGIRSMYVLVFTPTGEKKPLDEKYRVVRLIAE